MERSLEVYLQHYEEGWKKVTLDFEEDFVGEYLKSYEEGQRLTPALDTNK